MKALELYQEALRLSPRDPRYVCTLELAAELMAEKIKEMQYLLHQDLIRITMKQRFEDECG